MSMSKEDKFAARCCMAGISCIVAAIILGCWGCPHYSVWQQGMVGQAELERAEENRKIAVLEAQAKLDSASLLADAEVARAVGVAEANEIIGTSLRDNEAYLRYLWIQGLQDGSSEVIYVPTEANLPILEARNRPSSKINKIVAEPTEK